MTIHPTRRALIGSALTIPLWRRSASAATDAGAYPNQNVRVIIPYLAGGAADIVARIVAQGLGEKFGKTFVCDNRPGAGSNIGTEIAANSPADGYTLLVQGNPLASNVFLFKKIGYDPIKSFVPVAMHYRDYNVLIVNPSFEANSVQDIIKIAKAHPGQLNYSSSGIGTSTHLAGELFCDMAGIKMVHVPYRGVPPAVLAVMSGEVKMMFAGYGVVSGYVKEGKLKGLAVTGPHRLKMAPDLPTVAESGLVGFDATTWTGMFAPAGTPEPIVRKLNGAINAVIEAPSVRDNLEKRGFIVEAMAPNQVGKVVIEDMDRYGEIIRKTGAHAD
jgi:tripartite-type tricarboxylate transporter receptor subunit TctC